MSGYRILVVEDEPLVAMDIADALEAMGCETVGPFARVTDAIEVAATAQVDCAVLDVNVRGGQTTGVAELLLARGVPVLLTTGYSDAALSEPLIALPRLTKPYSSEQLTREVGRLCRPHALNN